MNNPLKLVNQDASITFYTGLALILLLAAVLRFYQLDEIGHFVFDEIFFPKYGHSYLTGKEFFHSHPPLYNYISAASIWLYYHLPWLDLPALNTLEFEAVKVMSYRWINAVAGTLLVYVAANIAFKLTQAKLVSLLLALFLAIDGTFIVDSRFAMNNLFLVLFGLLALLALVNAHLYTKKHLWLLAAGIFLGCSISIKWNGFAYMAFAIALVMSVFLVKSYNDLQKKSVTDKNEALFSVIYPFKLPTYMTYLVLVPALTYGSLWIPDRSFNTQHSFTEIHQQMMGYHTDMVKADEHPYCSRFYQWPIMNRPIGYYFNKKEKEVDGEKKLYYKDIHLFGNPALYWLSLLALTLMLLHWTVLLIKYISHGILTKPFVLLSAVLLGYCANLLPWAFVSRCLFFYHYQAAAVFAFFALAWYLGTMLNAKHWFYKLTGVACLTLIMVAFVYWLPLSLGLEIEAEAFNQRMWFKNWI